MMTAQARDDIRSGAVYFLSLSTQCSFGKANEKITAQGVLAR